MKKIGVWIALCGGLLYSCRDVQPAEQTALVSMWDNTFCGYCGGWIVQVDTTRYRADIPPALAKENNPVFIRFERDQRPGYRDSNWIIVTSIRQR